MDRKQFKVIQPKKSRLSKTESADISIGKASKPPSEPTLVRIYQEKLAKYCSRKFFYIFLVAEEDSNSKTILDQIYQTSKDYEELSSLTFISRDDVLDLLISNEDFMPKHLQHVLLNIVENLKNQPEDFTLLAEIQLLKLKLIQVMYQQYANQVKKNEKEKNLDSLLNTLSRECKRKQKKDETPKDEEKIPTKNEVKLDNKKIKPKDEKSNVNKHEDIDYTTFPIDVDGISYEQNIYNYINFYCIKGYYNAEIIKALIEQADVPICGIIKISDREKKDQSEILNIFWKDIEKLFFGNTISYNSLGLEDTILMHFTPSKRLQNSVNTLEEFVEMLRRIVNLKLTYLKYLRHLKINEIKHSYLSTPIECMQHYNTSLRQIPSECINTALILDALIKEIDFQILPRETPRLKSIFLPKSSVKSLHCIDPLYDFKAFGSKHNSLTSANVYNKPDVRTFLVHDTDVLMKILKSYKNIGPKIANTTLEFIKLFPIFRDLENTNTFKNDIIHLHDIDPEKSDFLTTNVSLEHFMYIFLFNKFDSKILPPPAPNKHDLLNKLIVFDVNKFWNEAQPKLIIDSKSNEVEDNIYDTSMVHFRWKEELSRDQLIQEMFNAFNNFLYVDKKYSPETNNFLFRFSNKLDHFGVNTKFFNETVRSPVCFRDFCRYVLINDSNWLENNQTKINESTYKVIFNENCAGAQNIKMYSKLFKDYTYLLDEDIKEEIDDQNLKDSVDTEFETNQNFEGFSEIFNNLKKCSTALNINEEFEQAIEDKQMLAYDLGRNVCKIFGKLTTFSSHDNVKVTIDNTRLLQSDEKCTFNITSDGNVLTLHSKECLLIEPYIVTMSLKDGSRVSFIFYNNISFEDKCKDGSKIDEEEIIESNIAYSPQDDDTKKEENNKEPEIANEKEPVVHCVDEDYMKTILDNKCLEEFPIEENPEDLVESIINAQENNGTIYKITTKSNYLEPNINYLKVPLKTAFRNILSLEKITNKEPKCYETFTKRFESPQDDKSDLELKRPLDFRICLPNGLYIKPHPNIVDENILLIKQEYVNEKPNVALVQHEEFRLFINQGLILIKKIDGTITILKSNGDIIDFEKPSDGSGENNTINTCHCSTIEDYRNKLNKLLKDQEQCDFTTSRRGHITSKHNHILDSKILKVLEEFDVPYLKKSITKFDGKRIKIQGDKITQKQLYHLTSQQDFFTGEILFERNDNFHSSFDRSASQKNIFPDGTVISSSIDVADELVDDFVYVKLSYQYQHPHYASVIFNFDKTCEIGISDNVVIKETIDDQSGGFNVTMDKGICVSFKQQNINFEKTCTDCEGKFEASFNLKHFQENSWKPLEEFLHVKDSYNKHFYSDLIGNCSRNVDYIKGSINVQKCNHFVKAKYKQLFIINDELTGKMFCTNDFVRTLIGATEKCPNGNFTTYNMLSNENITVADCRQKFYTSYAERFQNHSINTKLKKHPTHELYTTFRVFHKMFVTVDDIAKHLGNMQEVYLNDNIKNTNVCSNIDNLTNCLQVYYKKYQKELLAEEQENMKKKKKQVEKSDKSKLHSATCSCIKERRTMQEKIIQWKKLCNKFKKKKEIPSYFKSEFCYKENLI